MKRLLYTTVVLLVLVCSSMIVLSYERDSGKQEPAANSPTIRSIEGTTWVSVDSGRDFDEYTFLEGGQLRYTSKTSRKGSVTSEDEGDIWAQNGQVVIILKGYFSTLVGTLRGDRIEGRAWNARGMRWTWEVKEKY